MGVRSIRYRDRLKEIHKLGSAWGALTQSTVNRWINAAKKSDPDVEVQHVLNRRRWWPGIYTDWQPHGVIILGPYYDPLEDALYLGTGDSHIPLGDRKHGRVVERDPGWANRVSSKWRMKDSDAVGPYVAELTSLGYSLRDIVNLWKGFQTRHPDTDKAPRVRLLAKQLRHVRPNAMSYTTIGRILRLYSFGPVANKGELAQMTEDGDNIQ